MTADQLGRLSLAPRVVAPADPAIGLQLLVAASCRWGCVAAVTGNEIQVCDRAIARRVERDGVARRRRRAEPTRPRPRNRPGRAAPGWPRRPGHRGRDRRRARCCRSSCRWPPEPRSPGDARARRGSRRAGQRPDRCRRSIGNRGSSPLIVGRLAVPRVRQTERMGYLARRFYTRCSVTARRASPATRSAGSPPRRTFALPDLACPKLAGPIRWIGSAAGQRLSLVGSPRRRRRSSRAGPRSPTATTRSSTRRRGAARPSPPSSGA